MDALYARKNEIKVHVCYNEQGCAYAADGFARASGKLGVYFTTSGPGAVNAFGGLADAWFDGIPLVCVACVPERPVACDEKPGKISDMFKALFKNDQAMTVSSIIKNDFNNTYFNILCALFFIAWKNSNNVTRTF